MNLQDLKLTYLDFKHMTVYQILRSMVIRFGSKLILEAVDDIILDVEKI